MSSLTALYPSNPQDVPVSLTQPSAAFKKEVVKVMGSILLFFVVYIVLIVLSMALAAGCAYGGLMLIIAAPKFITLMVGLGLIGLGLLVFFFLVKFMFAVTRVDQSRSVELKEEDQPELFAFIRQITKDTQTPFPKKIFISPEVNAMVFYNSSFWSMLFPVKKNLEIGLGLVNTLNLSEFKAVLAHEFGHFSQRSMKLGSFVYNVNRVIYNMLYENSGYGSLLNKWAGVSGYFSFFAGITVRIVRGIQWILQGMYGFINRNYMSLSREMEFHADAVAASISGSDNLITALRRVSVANACYQTVIDKYNQWYKQNIVGNNFYPSQRLVMKRLSNERKMELDQYQLPVVDEAFFRNTEYGRVNYKDQWASHPAREDREAHLRGLNIAGETRQEPAWTLFRQPAELQEMLTAKLYNGVQVDEKAIKFEPQQFEEKFVQELSFYSYPKIYNGFYDGRIIAEFDVESIARNTQPREFSKTEFNSLFNNENAALAQRIEYLEGDIQTVKAIKEKSIQVKTFDLDGEKYTRQEAGTVLEKLQAELELLVKQQKETDEKAFRFFYAVALEKNAGDKLKQDYTGMFTRRREDKVFYDDCNALLDLINPLYTGEELTHERVSYIVGQLKESDEIKLKNNLRQLAREGIFASDAGYTALLNKFMDSQYAYFSDGSFFNNEFAELRRLIFEGCDLLSEYRFRQVKDLVEQQAALVPAN